MAKGTPEQHEMAQDALNRWWWPALMMFGPHDNQSSRTTKGMLWKIKRASNDELRQRFIDKTVPQAVYLGLTIPDQKLQWNEAAGHYDTGEINWEEFNRVVQGDGPCNRERMEHHKNVHAEGAWVREAAAAYAARQALVI